MSFIKELRMYRGMTVRNVKVYAKDRMAVFMSLMTPIIVLGLYLMFLKVNYVDMISEKFKMINKIVTDADVDALVNSWLIAGVLATSVVTVALNTLSTMVMDKEKRIDYDYRASAVRGRTVVMSYFSGALICTSVIGLVLLAAGLAFMAISGQFYYSFTDILALVGLVLTGSVSAVIILMLFISFFKKTSTFNSFGVMISVAIGFVVGAYIPVSQFSEEIQTVINLVPGSQIAGMLRRVMMAPTIDNISDKLMGLDGGAFSKGMNELFALKLKIFGNEWDTDIMLLYSGIFILVFIVLNILFYRISSKRKS